LVRPPSRHRRRRFSGHLRSMGLARQLGTALHIGMATHLGPRLQDHRLADLQFADLLQPRIRTGPSTELPGGGGRPGRETASLVVERPAPSPATIPQGRPPAPSSVPRRSSKPRGTKDIGKVAREIADLVPVAAPLLSRRKTFSIPRGICGLAGLGSSATPNSSSDTGDSQSMIQDAPRRGRNYRSGRSRRAPPGVTWRGPVSSRCSRRARSFNMSVVSVPSGRVSTCRLSCNWTGS
jgi:hypothetical protein